MLFIEDYREALLCLSIDLRIVYLTTSEPPSTKESTILEIEVLAATIPIPHLTIGA